MENDDKIYIAGHCGLVGSALLRILKQQGYINQLEHFYSFSLWKRGIEGDLS